jgi:hypothetical protein
MSQTQVQPQQGRSALQALVAPDGRVFRSGLDDTDLLKSVETLTARLQGITPTVSLVHQYIAEHFPDCRIQPDGLRRRLVSLDIRCPEEALFRQRVIQKTLNFIASSGDQPSPEKIKLRFSRLCAMCADYAPAATPDELRRAWYALRRRQPEYCRFTLTKPPATKLSARQRAVVTIAEELTTSLKRPPTVEELTKVLKSAKGIYFTWPEAQHRILDTTLKIVHRINRKLPKEKRITLTEEEGVLQKRAHRLLPILLSHIQRNQGSIHLTTFKAEVAAGLGSAISQNALKNTMHYLSSHAPDRSKLLVPLTAGTCPSSEIIAAYETVKALHKKLGVPRPPSMSETRTELAERGHTTLRLSTFISRIRIINTWRKKNDLPPLKFSSKKESLLPYAAAYAYTTHKQAHENIPMTYRALCDEVDELIAVRCSPERLMLAVRSAQDDKQIPASVKIVLGSIRPYVGFDIATVATYVKESTAQLGAPPLLGEILAWSSRNNISVAREHLAAVLRHYGIPFFYHRSSQVAYLCKKVMPQLRARYKKKLSITHLCDRTERYALKPERQELIAALTKLRRDAPASGAQYRVVF